MGCKDVNKPSWKTGEIMWLREERKLWSVSPTTDHMIIES